jgi:hypothetical protein
MVNALKINNKYKLTNDIKVRETLRYVGNTTQFPLLAMVNLLFHSPNKNIYLGPFVHSKYTYIRFYTHRALLILTVPQNPPKERNSNEDSPFFMYFKGKTSAFGQRAEKRILTF